VLVTVEAKELLSEISNRVSAFPPAMKHLGDAVLGAALMHALGDSDDEEKLELQWKCAGEFGQLYADVLGPGRMRATIQNPQPDVFDFDHGLGEGLMQARRVKGDYPASTGIIESSGDVGKDVISYLQTSEQKDCYLSTHVEIIWDKEAEARGDARPFKVIRADGFLIHILPQNDAKKKEDNLSLWLQRMNVGGPLSQWAMPENSKEALDFMLHILTVGSKPQSFGYQAINFDCTCSKERAKRALTLLSQSELDEMSVDEDGQDQSLLEITCEYCSSTYSIDLTQLKSE